MRVNSNLAVAIGAALRAGAEILDVYDSEIKIEIKDDRSPLTEADRRAHQVIAKQLSSTGIPLLSEEGKSIPYAVRREWKQFWLVDPLDGTKEFIKRNGEFTVNIALIDKGKPIMGVIYVPVKKVLYYGAFDQPSRKVDQVEPAGAGSTDAVLQQHLTEKLNGNAQALPIQNGRSNYAIVASRSHLSPETEAIIEEKRKQYGAVDTVSMGSSLKLCLVAEGRADLYPRLAPTMEWDTAAGHAIARYAGCRVYQAENGRELEYNKENLLNPWFVVERPGLK